MEDQLKDHLKPYQFPRIGWWKDHWWMLQGTVMGWLGFEYRTTFYADGTHVTGWQRRRYFPTPTISSSNPPAPTPETARPRAPRPPTKAD
jgi:hypothetical protein